jgi:hypothetical protein
LTANHKIHKRGTNQFDAGDWTDLTPSSVSSTSGSNYIIANVTSFSQFGASSSTSDFTSSLPVELTYFNGQKVNENSLLNWQTASEKNNEGFEIQRSTNGKDWEMIGFKLGQGTTQYIENYDFIDLQPMKGINYYRLKQFDFDGKFDYSNIITVEHELVILPTKIFPNPVRNQLNIINGQGLVTIYNILGQPVRKLIIDDEQSTIDVSDLQKGQYILHILKPNGIIVTQRFVK